MTRPADIATPVGYLLATPHGLEGKQGPAFDYILAANGVFIQAENGLLAARIRIADVVVKGLAPVTEKIALTYGLLPAQLLREGLAWTQRAPETERFFAIRQDDSGHGYRLDIPPQLGSASQVRYQTGSGPAVAEFHSHGRHSAHFSATDNADEQGCRIYGVIGRLDQPIPQLTMRLGIYGYFRTLEWSEVCDHPEQLPYHQPQPTGRFPA